MTMAFPPLPTRPKPKEEVSTQVDSSSSDQEEKRSRLSPLPAPFEPKNNDEKQTTVPNSVVSAAPGGSLPPATIYLALIRPVWIVTQDSPNQPSRAIQQGKVLGLMRSSISPPGKYRWLKIFAVPALGRDYLFADRPERLSQVLDQFHVDVVTITREAYKEWKGHVRRQDECEQHIPTHQPSTWTCVYKKIPNL